MTAPPLPRQIDVEELAVSPRRRSSRADAAGAPSAIVVGAGIVGLCIAWHLAKRGVQVTVCDPNAAGSGCSSGNAGALSPGSIIPLATMRTLWSAPGMLFNSGSALHIPPSYWLKGAPWLLRFIRSAAPSRVAQASNALASLYRQAVERHTEILAEIGGLDLLRFTGHLHLYRTAAQYAKDAPDWQTRERHGIKVQALARGEIEDLEPGVSDAYQIGMFLPEHGMSINPYRQSTVIAEELANRQVRFSSEAVAALEVEGRAVVGVRTGARVQRADHVVVAAGMGSAHMLRALGYAIPLESQRGYHIDLPDSGIVSQRPIIPADRKVFITPMETGLRVAGTVELLGVDAPPTEKRARLLLDDLAAVFPQARTAHQEPFWMGHRPCLPDSLPVIGPSRRWRGLWAGFGHGHLGLTGAAVTGDLIARAITGNPVPIDIAPFSMDRF